MDFFNNRYNNNNLYKNLYSDSDIKENDTHYIKDKEFNTQTDEEKIKELKEKLKLIKKEIKSQMLREEIKAEPFYDDEFLKHLDILNNFFSTYIPNFPKYFVDGKVNPRAFFDAKDLLENEFPVSTDEIIYSSNPDSGVMKPDKMNFENGYTVDSDGNVYNPDRRIIFNSNFENEKVKFIDLLNNKVITTNGIRLQLPDSFLDDYLVDSSETLEELSKEHNNPLIQKEIQIKQNEYLNPKIIKEKIRNFREEAKKYPKDIENLLNLNNTFASYYGHSVSYENKYMVELPVENMYLSDIFTDIDKINFGEEIKQYNTPGKELGICNFKDIPYGELSSLLLWGGGEKGKKPLSSSVISDKDIIFAQDGTAKYTNVNSTVRIKRNGCSERTYKTGHVCMWTSQNRLGLKRSIIQYIYMFCAGIGLFNANIPNLLGFKRIKIFGGLCIGGLLERVLCAWQERISKRINEMFQCVPAPLDTDLSKSGFENATFPHGPSIDDISILDTKISVKFGDRFVINKVPPNITGNKGVSCGVFFFDPNQKLNNFCPWRYKGVWAGKPFNANDNFQMVEEYSNPFNNPLIQDLLSNTNVLGEDSITRKLMSLLYAFLKKQIVLESTELETSIEVLMENVIYDSLQKLTSNLARFDSLNERLKNFNNETQDTKNKITSDFNAYVGELRNYINFSIPAPSLDNLSQYDALLYAYKNIPTEETKRIFRNNLIELSKINSQLSKSYKRIKTIRDYLNATGKYEEFYDQLKTTIDFISYDLNLNGYSKETFQQCVKRANALIDEVSII